MRCMYLIYRWEDEAKDDEQTDENRLLVNKPKRRKQRWYIHQLPEKKERKQYVCLQRDGDMKLDNTLHNTTAFRFNSGKNGLKLQEKNLCLNPASIATLDN